METIAPGAYNCINLTKYTQIDVMRMQSRIISEKD